MTPKSGFTLIELMIVCTFIGILTYLVLPIFTTHFMHAHRLSAELSLLKTANALEQYYLSHETYQGVTFADLGLSNQTADHNYQLVITSASANDYEIAAIPQGTQTKDTECATLLLAANGTRKITGTGYAKNCWQ